MITCGRSPLRACSVIDCREPAGTSEQPHPVCRRNETLRGRTQLQVNANTVTATIVSAIASCHPIPQKHTRKSLVRNPVFCAAQRSVSPGALRSYYSAVKGQISGVGTKPSLDLRRLTPFAHSV